MAPVAWTTTEQADFLALWLPQYLEHTQTKKYHAFWPPLFIAWFQKWPERDVLFPTSEEPLDAAQNEALAAAVGARKHQLCTWFRWRANASRRSRLQQKQTSVFEKVISPKGSRVRTPAELYMLEYYDDRIKPQLMAQQEAGNIPSGSSGNVLNAVRKFSQDLLEAEDDDVRARIQQMYELQERKAKKDATEPEEETDPIKIQQAIDDLPYALARIAKLIKYHTRFAVSFVCAGPDPSRNWEITSISCHPDETPDGKTFASLFPEAETGMLAAFQGYAERLFPPELRDPTKCLPVSNCEDGNVDITQDKLGDQSENGAGGEQSTDEGRNEEGENENEWENAIGEGNADGQGTSMGDVGGDELQISNDASRPLEDGDASFGDWHTSGTVAIAPSHPEQSMTHIDASTQRNEASGSMSLQNPFSVDLCSAGGIPQPMPVQLSSSLTPMSGYVSGAFIPPAMTFGYGNGLSFSDAMRDLDADFSGHNWDFSKIDLGSFGTPPLSDLRSTQFPDATTASNPELPPLPPIEENPSPARPRLPPVPPPSPPDELPQGAQSGPKTSTKSRPKPRVKRSAAAAPDPPIAAETSATPSTAASPPDELPQGVQSGPKTSTKSRPKPRVKRSAAAAPDPPIAAETSATPSTAASTTNAAMASTSKHGPKKATKLNVKGSTSTANSATLNTSESAPIAPQPPPVATAAVIPPHEATPLTEQPQTHRCDIRTSKRVPIQSKRNAKADAIGTNRSILVVRGDARQESSTSPKKGKRPVESAEGVQKKKKKTN